jgi:hypothetical protein
VPATWPFRAKCIWLDPPRPRRLVGVTIGNTEFFSRLINASCNRKMGVWSVSEFGFSKRRTNCTKAPRAVNAARRPASPFSSNSRRASRKCAKRKLKAAFNTIRSARPMISGESASVSIEELEERRQLLTSFGARCRAVLVGHGVFRLVGSALGPLVAADTQSVIPF